MLKRLRRKFIGTAMLASLIVFALLAKPVMDLLARALDWLKRRCEHLRHEWDL